MANSAFFDYMIFGKLIQQALSTEFVPLRFQNNEEDEK